MDIDPNSGDLAGALADAFSALRADEDEDEDVVGGGGAEEGVPNIMYCGSVNHPLVDRKYHVYGLYQTENLVCWIDGCGNQGGQRLQQSPDKRSFTSGVILSSRTRPDELGYTRGHGRHWYDGYPVVPAGEESFAYWSVHFSKNKTGPMQGYHFYWMRHGAPILWFDHLHDQGYVFRGVGFVHDVRTVSGTRFESNFKHQTYVDAEGKKKVRQIPISDPAPRRVLFTHVKFRMYTAATVADPAWLNLLRSTTVTAQAFEPYGWSSFCRRYFARNPAVPVRRFIFGDTVRGLQPPDLRDDEDMRLPEEFRRGRNTNVKKIVAREEDEEGHYDEEAKTRANTDDTTRGISILYEDYIKLLATAQFERGALNGMNVPGVPPASGLAMPGLAPEWTRPDY